MFFLVCLRLVVLLGSWGEAKESTWGSESPSLHVHFLYYGFFWNTGGSLRRGESSCLLAAISNPVCLWLELISNTILHQPYTYRLNPVWFVICLWCFHIQGCALREITRRPKFPNYEIQGAQHKAYMKEIRLSGRPKAKISRLRHPGTLRAQP